MLVRPKNRFIRHEPCPKCGSRDNLARYSDESAWCFGCGYYEGSKWSLTRAREMVEPTKVGACEQLRLVGMSKNLEIRGIRAHQWLKSYGLTPEECQHFKWDLDRKRLVFTNGDFWQGRAFDALGPKYLSGGKLPDEPIIFGSGDTCICVEDVVSAIKVGRHTAAAPMFGAHVHGNWLNWLSGRFKGVGIWLDPDKHREAATAALRGLSLGVHCFGVYSTKDPKEHTDAEILDYLRRVIVSTH